MKEEVAEQTIIESLNEKYEDVLETTTLFSRKEVSYQDSRKRPFFSWFKFKEAFSAVLVDKLIRQHGQNFHRFMDPFAGTGTSLFIASMYGMESEGIEILPLCQFIIKTISHSVEVDPDKLGFYIEGLEKHLDNQSTKTENQLNYLRITLGAYPENNEKSIIKFKSFLDIFEAGIYKDILLLAGLASLEECSYTRKDGQFLRWDRRANRPYGNGKFQKKEIKDFRTEIIKTLRRYQQDLLDSKNSILQNQESVISPRRIHIHKGSALDILPLISDNSYDLAITSPPYCNRYDYTRTYALELAFLNFSDANVKELRQNSLTCTVENASKVQYLAKLYQDYGRYEDFNRYSWIFNEQNRLSSIIDELTDMGKRHLLNNSNIPNLIYGYFFEMNIIIQEMSRTLSDGGCIFMINDNVRYGGIVIPVDYILSDFAEASGMTVKNIWQLERGKGNSSQQMAIHGREELRKCIYHWEK